MGASRESWGVVGVEGQKCAETEKRRLLRVESRSFAGASRVSTFELSSLTLGGVVHWVYRCKYSKQTWDGAQRPENNYAPG